MLSYPIPLFVSAKPYLCYSRSLAPLPAEHEAAAPYCLLVDGLLRYACQQLLVLQDAHLRYHTACVVCLCVQQLVRAWREAAGQGRPPLGGPDGAEAGVEGCVISVEFGKAGVEGGEAAAGGSTGQGGEGGRGTTAGAGAAGAGAGGVGGGAPVGCWVAPTLGGSSLSLLMEVVWTNMEEPIAQTARQVGGVCMGSGWMLATLKLF